MRFVLLMICVVVGAFASPSAQSAELPNLVFMIADDCTYLDLSVYGGQAKTAHLEQLAAEGMQFSRCFQAAPMCSPTRHNIYTGIYPVKSGAWPNHTRVYPGTKSIAHYLKDAGYRGLVWQDAHQPSRIVSFRVFRRVPFGRPREEGLLPND